MKMELNDIVKEIPENLVPTYKKLGWQEVINKPIVKPEIQNFDKIEKVEKVEKTEKLTKGFKHNKDK